jgi:hypothetical protein
MAQFFSLVVNNLAGPFAVTITGAFTVLSVQAIRWMEAHVKLAQSARAHAVLEAVRQTADDVVHELAQTQVEALKAASADGKLTPADIAMVSKAALEKTKANLGGDAGVAKVQKILNSVLEPDEFVIGKNEAAKHKLDSWAATTSATPAVVAATSAATSAAISASVATVEADAAISAAASVAKPPDGPTAT